jgi:hypothetical protein
MDEVHTADPDTPQGQLQRGRGLGAHAVARSPESARPAVFDCVCRDPRWDHQVEERDLYYGRLILANGWPLNTLRDHLFSDEDAEDQDEWRTGLALAVLGVLVRASRGDARELLRRYIVEGWNWRWALDDLSAARRPELLDSLDELVLRRFSDDELAAEVHHGWGPWDFWASRQPRVRAAFEAGAARPSSPKPEDLVPKSNAELIELVRSGGHARRVAAIALGDRGDPILLDLAEELLSNHPSGVPGVVSALLRLPGEEVVGRARAWVREARPYADVGIWILSERGDERDIDPLIGDLEASLATSNWSGAVQPINGLGRLGARRAAPLILQAWHVSEYSYLRPRALDALLALTPSQATALAEEGLWDCEELARQRSAQVASLTDSTRPRLEALSEDELERKDVRTSAAARLR